MASPSPPSAAGGGAGAAPGPGRALLGCAASTAGRGRPRGEALCRAGAGPRPGLPARSAPRARGPPGASFVGAPPGTGGGGGPGSGRCSAALAAGGCWPSSGTACPDVPAGGARRQRLGKRRPAAGRAGLAGSWVASPRGQGCGVQAERWRGAGINLGRKVQRGRWPREEARREEPEQRQTQTKGGRGRRSGKL